MKFTKIKKVKDTIWPWCKSHQVASIVILIVLCVGLYEGGQKVFGTSGETKYVLARASIGELKTVIAGTGQVAASNQIDLQAKASGNITSVNAKVGQELKAGDIIAKIDSRAIALSLESSRIALQKLTNPADESTISQTENSLADAKQTKAKAQDDLDKAYEDALTAVSNSFIDIPTIISGMKDMFYGSSGYLSDRNTSIQSTNSQVYRDAAGVIFDIAYNNYTDVQNEYRATARSNATGTTEALITKTYNLVSKLSESLKNSTLTIENIRSKSSNQTSSDGTTALSSVNSWTTKNNSNLNSLLSAKNAIETARNTLATADRNIKEKTLALSELQDGADPLDVRSQVLNVRQKELEYENYIIRAPFDGILAKLDVKVGDTASGVVGTFITKQKIAEITLNEVDAANVKIGQTAELTFDAVDGLVATGTVASIDLVGTVSQGVVSYTAQIAFDNNDDRIKPGMSVSASITTSSKNNILIIPVSALKTKGNSKYVEVATGYTASRPGFANGNVNVGVTLKSAPVVKTVTVGDSTDTYVEITSGLEEGEFVVTKTTTTAGTATKTSAGSLLGATKTSGNRSAGMSGGMPR